MLSSRPPDVTKIGGILLAGSISLKVAIFKFVKLKKNTFKKVQDRVAIRDLSEDPGLFFLHDVEKLERRLICIFFSHSYMDHNSTFSLQNISVQKIVLILFAALLIYFLYFVISVNSTALKTATNGMIASVVWFKPSNMAQEPTMPDKPMLASH